MMNGKTEGQAKPVKKCRALDKLALAVVREMPGKSIAEMSGRFMQMWRTENSSQVDNTLLTMRLREAVARLVVRGRVRREGNGWFANGLED